MMRMHTLYHRLTLFSFSSPLSLLPLAPPLHLTLGRRTAANFSMATSRLRHIAPLAAASTEDGAGGGGASNGSVSSSSTADASNDYEDDSPLGVGYRVPPPEIRDIVDAPPVPALSFSPYRDKIIFLKRRALPPLTELARPEEKLAGLRIDGHCNSRSRMSFYTGLGIHQILPDGTLGPEVEIHGTLCSIYMYEDVFLCIINLYSMNCWAYYRCKDQNCNIRKQVERDAQNSKYVIVFYEGRHNHEAPPKQRSLTFSINTTATVVSENVGMSPPPLTLPTSLSFARGLRDQKREM